MALAVAYAQYVACLDRGETDSCGVCSSCVKYSQLIHPDLHFTFPIYGSDVSCDDFMPEFREAFTANPLMTLPQWLQAAKGENKKPNINIRECRNIIRKLSLKTYESDFKVLIMWLPEYLGKEGNVLLKLIEEPPQNTLFLLVTENQEAILSTIISRTQYSRILPYTYAEVESYLISKGIASGDLARNAALMAEGNLSKAIELASEMDNPQLDDFRNWMLMCYQGKLEDVLGNMEHFTEKGKDGIKMFLHYGLHLLRSSLMFRHMPETERLTPAEADFVRKFAEFIHLGNIEEIYKSFNDAVFEIDRNGNVKLILINLSLTLKNCLRMPRPSLTA